ncbi:MAG TPA: BMP family ABC transporter substrate-binding protein [Candidatus Dormibacteraeota bacterium]|nr:BMP family ABC transporter substrate-binding protein [Candidatus Dormibacteraeota bacterium]
MRSIRWRHAVLVALMAVVATACGGDGDGQAKECTSDFQVGVAYDVGGLGDRSFNDAAHAGLQRAIADDLVDAACATSNQVDTTGSNRGANVQALARGGYDLVVGVGFGFSTDIAAVAPDHPDTSFMVVDGAAAGANVVDFVFRENEGSFLVGAAAALKCGCDTIGFLGGQTGPLIGKFEAGYAAGARAVNPNIAVLARYIGDDASAFNDPSAAEALSNQMYDAGAEVIYHASGGSGAGLFAAAAAQGKWAIGVDSDQYLTARADQRPYILTSMLKRVDVAVHEAIRATKAGTFTSGQRVFGMAENGVGYATSNPALASDIVAALETYRQEIIAGEIVVPTEP